MMRSRYFKVIPAFIILAVLTVCMIYKDPVYATAGMIVLDDGADLFTEEEEADLQRIAWEYAERFYGIRPGSRNEFVFFTRDYALYGVRQHQGCTFPETLVIEYSDELREIEYERINLIA